MSLAEDFRDDSDVAQRDLELSTAVADGGTITLGGRYQIMADSPLPELASPGTEAYSARDTGDPNNSVYCLVLDGRLPARTDDLPSLRRLDRPPLLTPKSWGVIPWDEDGGERFCIVIERPGGRRIFEDNETQIKPWSDDRIARFFIKPMIQVMRALGELMIPHRNLRVDNIFFQDAVTGEIIVGECYSAPPAVYQPVVYETVGSSLADPGGRGIGNQGDDLYALGICITFLLFGRNTVAHLSDDEVIRMKMEQGTYSTVIGDARVPSSLMEPLRGLLTDDRNDRWKLTDLDLWLNGRRMSPLQPKLLPKAARPFTFDMDDYYTTPALALAFSRNWSQATRSISNDPIDTWIRRGLGNEGMANQYASAIRTAAAFGGRHGVEDRMVARACIVFDPSGPVRYRSIAFRANGFATLLLMRFVSNEDLQDLQEAIVAKLPHFWLDMQAVQRPEHQVWRRQYDMVAAFMNRGGPGYGLERALYELNPGAPCLSGLLENSYVLTLIQLLPGLDRTAVERGGMGEPMDRHIAAFIAARTKGSMDAHLQALALVNDEPARRLAIIRLLAEVQQQTGQDTPPNLAQWAARISGPIVDSYHSAVFRDRLAKEIKKIADRNGSLMDMAFALENTTRREKDNEGFESAVREYAEAENDINRIEAGEMTDPEAIEKRGQAYAAMGSAGLASISLIGIIAVRLFAGI